MLQVTPLAQAHRAMGGKLVDFSGWSMPVNYGSQMDEHHAVRRHAGMFDVSHMTVVDVCGSQAQAYLRHLLANDVIKLKTPGKALYSAMLNPQGGVLDDLIVYLLPEGDHSGGYRAKGYRIVVNCATRAKDLAWMSQQAADFTVTLQERPELAMIAVQGPEARAQVHRLLPEADRQALAELSVFSASFLANEHSEWLVARTGYTGEDGYEVMLPGSQAEAFWNALAEAGVTPCGLGARDTLRLEAGMNLYGHEMDETTSPLVANMAWTVDWAAGRSFVGRDALLAERDTGIKEKLVGLVLSSKGVLRAGYPVQVAESEATGVVTSGSFSPTLGCSIALARVPMSAGSSGTVSIRGKWVDVDIVKPCFVRHGEPV